MKIIIAHPSFDDAPGNPQTSQNRQAQYFEHGAYIFPVVLASAATMLKNGGHAVEWVDGPAQGMDEERFLKELEFFEPELILMESKTPSIKRTWNITDKIKKLIPYCKVVICGDHVTALPEETIANSDADYVLKGGDYDFSLARLVSEIESKNQTHNRTVLDYGTNHGLENVQIINREIAKWRLYAYDKGSGNYKYLPGTHTMFGRDCWWRHQGGCTFCSWTNTFKNWRVTSVSKAMAEVEACASLGIREVFDDTGTFPIGNWLYSFCEELRKFNKGLKHGKARITMGCNMQPGVLKEEDWKGMASAGFRFILFGFESANDATNKRINKRYTRGDIENSCQLASKYGLDPHVTTMVGYPWETKSEAQETINLCKSLFKKGWIKTLQATICVPYPGTALYSQCLENDWLKYKPGDWDHWDMRKPVMKSPMSDEEILGMTRGIYKSCITPQFIARKLYSARTKDDWKYLLKGAKYMLGHLSDFSGK